LAAAAAGLAPAAVGRAGADTTAVDPLAHLRPTGPLDENYWKLVQREFNVVDDMIYMNNGTIGPLPRTVLEAQVRYLREVAEDPRRNSLPEEVRDKVAAFVGADPDEIALTRSTTEGIRIFTQGLDLKPGDEILMTSHEHPGGYGPWKAREVREGLKVNVVDIPAPPENIDQIVELVDKAITPKTRVLMISHVVFVTGLVTPIKELAELARRRGVLSSVDAAHALGMLALDLHDSGVDHYSTAGQKWLMAGSGTGVAYFKRDIQDQIRVDMWREEEDPKAGARKYERWGQRNIPSARGMGDAVDFHNAIGRQNVEARTKQLGNIVREGLTAIPGVELGTSDAAELSGGLTTFSLAGVPQNAITKAVMDMEGIYIVRSRWTPNACRVSTHIYNKPSQIDRLLGCIRHIAENPGNYQEAATA
jgi:selenocysteine lyase/cysteine desulfurase